MSAKKELPLEEYVKKLQDAADKIVNERKVVKIEVILSGDKFECAREGEQLDLAIFKEALSIVNKKYELKAEAPCVSKPNAPKVP